MFCELIGRENCSRRPLAARRTKSWALLFSSQTFQAPTMLVHRCRFVEYQPSPVQCLALDKSGNKLAVGRENGAVEIWNVKGLFYLDRVRASFLVASLLLSTFNPKLLAYVRV